MMVFHDELFDFSDDAAFGQIPEDQSFGALDVELHQIDWCSVDEGGQFRAVRDRALVISPRRPLGIQAHEQRSFSTRGNEELDGSHHVRQRDVMRMYIGQLIRLDVTSEHLERRPVGLEAMDDAARVQPLEEERGHSDVRTTVKDERLVTRRIEPILAADEDFPEQEVQRLVVERLEAKSEKALAPEAEEWRNRDELEREAPVGEQDAGFAGGLVPAPQDVRAVKHRSRERSEGVHTPWSQQERCPQCPTQAPQLWRPRNSRPPQP